MGAASYYWIKLYQDILRDPKMGRLSDSAFRRCIELFLVAGEQPERDGRLIDPGDLAWQLRITREQLDKDLEELEQAGIVIEKDSLPFVKNFAKRQEKVSAAERMRRYRKRKQKEEQENDPVTDESQGGDDAVTNRNTDKETETDKEQEGGDRAREGCPVPAEIATPAFLNVWGEWNQQHKDQGHEMPFRTQKRQLEKLRQYSAETAVGIIENSLTNNYKGLIFPNGKHGSRASPSGSDDTMERLQARLRAQQGRPDE